MSLPVQTSYPVNSVNYKHLFLECPVSMYVFDPDTYEILEANTSALLQYGYNRKEFIGSSVLNIRPEQDVAFFIERSKQLPSAYYDAGRWRHRKKNGTVFHVHVYSHKTLFDDKEAVLALAIDVNEQAENEMKLKEMVQKLEMQNEKLQHFSWLNSHRIRNHVANILGLAALYNEDKADPELNHIVITNIEKSAKALDEVLKGIAVEINREE